jgi:hypothetical protein
MNAVATRFVQKQKRTRCGQTVRKERKNAKKGKHAVLKKPKTCKAW